MFYVNEKLKQTRARGEYAWTVFNTTTFFMLLLLSYKELEFCFWNNVRFHVRIEDVIFILRRFLDIWKNRKIWNKIEKKHQKITESLKNQTQKKTERFCANCDLISLYMFSFMFIFFMLVFALLLWLVSQIKRICSRHEIEIVFFKKHLHRQQT